LLQSEKKMTPQFKALFNMFVHLDVQDTDDIALYVAGFEGPVVTDSDLFYTLMSEAARSKLPLDQKLALAEVLISHMAIPRGAEPASKALARARQASVRGRVCLLVGSKSEEFILHSSHIMQDLQEFDFAEPEIASMKSLVTTSRLFPHRKLQLKLLLEEKEKVAPETVDFVALFELLATKDTSLILSSIESRIDRHHARCVTDEEFAFLMKRLPQLGLAAEDVLCLTNKLIKNMNKYPAAPVVRMKKPDEVVVCQLARAPGKRWQAGTLDNVIVNLRNCDYQLFDPNTGLEITDETKKEVLEAAQANIAAQKYLTTDHAIIKVKQAGATLLVVSLDNSERANKNGSPAFSRIPAICAAIKSIVKDEPFAVAFLESCRRSFDGDREVPWPEVVARIKQECGVVHLGEFKNNPGDMSFGISLFGRGVDPAFVAHERLLAEGFGNVALAVEFENGSLFWVVGLPFDLSGATTLAAFNGLVDLMHRYPNSVAVGDLNAIAEVCAKPMIDTLAKTNLRALVPFSTPTFFPAFFDPICE